MKKTIPFIFSLSLLLAGINLWAQDTINITNLGGAKINITDTTYTIGTTVTTYTGPYVITGKYSLNGTGTNQLLFRAGNYTDTTFTIANLSLINSTTYTLLVKDDNVVLNLVGYNYIEGSRAIYPSGGAVIFTGDSLYAKGNSDPAIGSGQSKLIPKLVFNGGFIYAQTATTKPAIGHTGTNCDSIIINGGIITTVSEGVYNIKANNICINGGSVKGTLSRKAVNASGDTVYCVTVPHNGQLSIMMNDGIKDSTLAFYAHHPADDNFYIYLPNGNYSFTNGDGATYTAIVDGADAIATVPAIVGDGIIDVSPGTAVNVYDTAYYIGAQPYTYQGHKFTFTGTASTGGVTVYSKLADTITFSDLNIEMNNGCAFSLQTGTDISLMLEGTSTLKSTGVYAGLEKDSTAGMLSICGPDTLITTGGTTGNGIGGYHESTESGCGDITIKAGTIYCSGLYGIGGGSKKAGIITIEGGIVKASAITSRGAALGNAGHILINGGIVEARSTGEYIEAYPLNGTVTINGGIVDILSKQGTNMPSGITINGGTVFARNEYEAATTFTGGTFTGGSIKMVEADGKTVDITQQPVDADSTILYRSMYRLPDISQPTPVESITINGVAWGSNGVYTDSTGMLYLWAPEASGSQVSITVDGKTFTYTGDVIAYNDYVPADALQGIPEYGNYLWQVPLNIETEGNGTIAVSSNGTTLASGDYFCFKTSLPLSITGHPETGCEIDSITVYGSKTIGDTTIVVGDTLKIAASFSLQEFIVSFYNIDSDGTLSVTAASGDVNTGEMVEYGTELTITATASDGYVFDSLSINGMVTAKNDTNITVTEAINLVAFFSEKLTGLANVLADNIIVYSSNNTVFVKAYVGAQIAIYNLSGKTIGATVAQSSTESFAVPQKGIYLVKVVGDTGSSTIKYLVK